MTKAHCRSAAAPVTPRSTTTSQTINIDAVTTNGTTPGGREPIQGAQCHDLERIPQWLLAVASPKASAGRLERIAEGIRQTTAPTSTRDGLQNNGKGKGQEGHEENEENEGNEGNAPCPVTGGYCGEIGYGPYGIHVACVRLDISAYCE